MTSRAGREPHRWTKAADAFDLGGRVAVITGGAGMLGRQHAEVVAEAGGCPVLVDLEGAQPERAAAEIAERFGGPALGVAADVTQKTDVRRAVEATLSRFDRLDILVNNASLTVRGGAEGLPGYFAPFEEYDLDAWRRALDVGLTGVFLMSQAAGRVMVDRGGGVIMNIASTAGVVGPDHRIYEGINDPYTGRPFNTPIAYSATKSGVLGMTRYLATYWAARNIRVNALSPGGVFDGHGERFVEAYSHRVPLGRMAERSEYKGAVLFLVSDASSYMTGANLIVDGGWTCW
jgi:NAD(P)-dependent dehydrogenase (short-subunit alcohol dehydrogenase family)